MTYLQPLIEVNPMAMSIYISNFYLHQYKYVTTHNMDYYYYWHKTQIWIEIGWVKMY
jgi:hypothetical protein